jgi:hypothetical protein
VRAAGIAAWTAISAVALALPGGAAAQEPAGYRSLFADTLASRIFPLFATLRTAPGWAEALSDDPVLRRLAAERATRVAEGECAPVPQCLTQPWVWTDADVAAVDARLRLLVRDHARADALVTQAMRRSGRFARHEALGDADMLSAAWREAAAAVNRIIAVYARGEPPRYPKIDAIIFDPASPDHAMVLEAHGVATVAMARGSDLFFDPSLRYATGLLQMNERIDAGSFRPLLEGENAATVRAIAATDWTDKAYSALLVFGHGPEDAQSRTGVMGHIRLAIAADLYGRGLAPFLIVSGGNVHPNRTPFNEAVEMKRLLVTQYDIPADRILIEPHARHTTTNLRNTARLLLAAPFPRNLPALVVSDDRTIKYVASDLLARRNVAEMGIQPGRPSPGPNRFTLRFVPDGASFHADAIDPLDP